MVEQSALADAPGGLTPQLSARQPARVDVRLSARLAGWLINERTVMDSRIEELAQIISDRAGAAAENTRNAAGGILGDRYHSWRRLHTLARDIQAVIDEYRRDHPEEYRDDEAERLRGMIDTYVSELVDARQQLARYKEREAVQGWAPL